MDYFTRAWADGELSDDESEMVMETYRGYVDSLDHATSVWKFATTVGLNDAWVDRVQIGSDAVSLMLLTGDLQRGYWHTTLTYSGAKIAFGLDHLQRAVRRRPTEVQYDEFAGRLPDMVHRFLLVNANGVEDRGEFHVQFSDFTFSETRAEGRFLPPLRRTFRRGPSEKQW